MDNCIEINDHLLWWLHDGIIERMNVNQWEDTEIAKVRFLTTGVYSLWYSQSSGETIINMLHPIDYMLKRRKCQVKAQAKN